MVSSIVNISSAYLYLSSWQNRWFLPSSSPCSLRAFPLRWCWSTVTRSSLLPWATASSVSTLTKLWWCTDLLHWQVSLRRIRCCFHQCLPLFSALVLSIVLLGVGGLYLAMLCVLYAYKVVHKKMKRTARQQDDMNVQLDDSKDKEKLKDVMGPTQYHQEA